MDLNFLADTLKGKINYLAVSKPLNGVLMVLKDSNDLFYVASFLKNSSITSYDQLMDLLGN